MKMKVVIAGSGNVASILSVVIQRAGHEIVQIVGRTSENAKELASKHNAQYCTLLDDKFADADIYIIALTDAGLESVGKMSGFKNKLIVHTAGSVPMEVLKNLSSTYGVLYPLQTLSKESDHIPGIPFLIDGSNKETVNIITAFAKTLSDKVMPTSDAERLHYHVAAVFVGNFTNHLAAVTESFCEKEKLDFKILLPLVNEVTYKINHFSPREMQTGPAIREDIVTLNRHLQALSSNPDLKYIYLKLSESILKLHQKSR